MSSPLVGRMSINMNDASVITKEVQRPAPHGCRVLVITANDSESLRNPLCYIY